MTPAEEVSLLKAHRAGDGAADHTGRLTRIGATRIARVLGITRQAVVHRAALESWAYTEQNVRGGRRRLYHREGLPKEIQAALETQEILAAMNGGGAALRSPARPAASNGVPAESAPSVPTAPAEQSITRRGLRRKAKAASAMSDQDRSYQHAAVTLAPSNVTTRDHYDQKYFRRQRHLGADSQRPAVRLRDRVRAQPFAQHAGNGRLLRAAWTGQDDGRELPRQIACGATCLRAMQYRPRPRRKPAARSCRQMATNYCQAATAPL